MAADVANHITWLLHLALPHRHYLGQVRHWSNLQVAQQADGIWVKGFTTAQLKSVEVKSIPFTTIYYCKDTQLFLLEKLVPVGRLPEALVWEDIASGLPVSLPRYNHNYFGIPQTLPVKLVTCTHERQAYAMLVKLPVLQSYIETAPALRLQVLQWTLLDKETACIIGAPLLPVQGEVFWKDERFLLPVGYDFEWRILSEVISQTMDNPYNWVLWQQDGSWLMFTPQQLQPLSISSFRLTMQKLAHDKRKEG